MKIDCSNCEAPLCEVWTRDENEKKDTLAVVMCDHCGDKSFQKEFKGSLYVGSTDFTEIISMDIEENKEQSNGRIKQKLTITTRKIQEYV